MTTTLKGATTLAMVLGLTTATTAQAKQDEPRGQQQQGQVGQEAREQPPVLDDRQDQQHTVRGRMTSIRLGPLEQQTGQQSSSERPGQAGQSDLQTREGAGQQATIMVSSRSMVGNRPEGQGQGTQSGSGREPQERGEGQLQDRPADQDLQPGLDQPAQQGMAMYQFLVTDETLIQANNAADQPGQRDATDRPDSGQQPGQAGQQAPGARPGQGRQSVEEGQPAPQEFRGLRVGQSVEVTYRPLPNAPQDQPRHDQNEPERPRSGQVGQDPTELHPGQAGQGEPGRMIRGEALSIRVIPASDLDKESDQPAPGVNTPDRPNVDSPRQRPGTDEPSPTP
jgi:hypothetical protein